MGYFLTATVIGVVLLAMAVWPSLFPRVTSSKARIPHQTRKGD